MCLRTVTRLLLSAIVLLVVCLAVLRAQQVAEEEEVVETKGIQDIDLNAWLQSYTENQKLLVLLYTLDNCDGCPAALDILTQVQGQQGLPKGLVIAKSASPELVAKIGTDQFPKLVYLRDKTHVIYDGNFAVAEILQWILQASNTIIQRLDDNSFADVISAAPGVNAEDWLLVFYKEACKNTLTAVESLGVKVYGRIKIAKIHSPENPKLALRFNVANCPEIIFIKQGKVYRYTSQNIDVASLQDFVDNSFNNSAAEELPEVIPEDSDSLAESVTDFIKIHLREDNQPIIVAGVCALVASLVLLVFCCCRPKTSPRPKKSKKE